MTLLENTVAALLFSAVAAVSLGVWSLGLTAEVQRAERQRNGDRIDAELTALDLRLRAGAAGLQPGGDCASASQQLAALVAQQPPAAGLLRQVSVGMPAGSETADPAADSAAELGLWVTVAIADADPGGAGQGWAAAERRRWFSPAALGLCGGWAEADATPR